MQYTRSGPKGTLSPTLGEVCPICDSPLLAGDYTTLVPRSESGRYADDAAEVHWDCATRGQAPPLLVVASVTLEPL